jgi:hypothetical protein
LVAAVQSSVTNNTPLDLIVLSPTTTASNRYVRFVSDDHATATQRPLLTINYSIVNPALPTVTPGAAPAAMRDVPASLAGVVSNASGGSLWSLVSGPGMATFADAANPATSVTFSAPGSYTLRLTAANPLGEASRTLALTVAANPAVFADWQSIEWPGVNDPDIIGESADPDGDGTPNLLEFALRMTPDAPDRPMLSLDANGPAPTFTYTRARHATGVSFFVEWSDTLLPGSWSNQGVGETLIDDTKPGTQTIRATLPAGGGRQFVRLRVAR